jgi:hypothetical protein
MGKTSFKILLLSLLTLLTTTLHAGPGLYPQPLTPRFEAGDERLTCRDLEERLAALYMQTYSGKPGFYDDPYNGASLWAGTLWSPGAWSYLAYSGVADYAEYARMHDAENRMQALRYLKARRRCHE